MRRTVEILGYSERSGISDGRPWCIKTVYLSYDEDVRDGVINYGHVAGAYDYSGDYNLTPACVGLQMDAIFAYDKGLKRRVCVEFLPKGGDC